MYIPWVCFYNLKCHCKVLEQDAKSIQLLFCALLDLNLHVEEAKLNNESSLWDQQKFKHTVTLHA